MKKLTAILLFGVCAFSLHSEIWTPRIIGDNMILQRAEPVKIWGEALPDAKIEAKFGKFAAKTTADKDGKWLLEFPAMEADKNGKSIELYENGKLSKEIKNVLVGEVWIASGQSNMGFVMKNAATYEEAKKSANNPSLRFFVKNLLYTKDAQKDSSKESEWIACNEENIGGVSAVSYYFAETLNKDLDIPVGVIIAEKGGSPMSAWVAREDIDNYPVYLEIFAKWEENVKNYDYEKALAAWEKYVKERAKKPKAERGKKRGKPSPDGPGFATRYPGYLFNGRLSFATNYTAKGFIWYQGEADSKGYEIFGAKLQGLIEIWRKRFGKPDMPFYFVQLPSFELGRNWAQTRWAQFETSKKMKNVEMAVTIDSGEEKNIHPKEKKHVGARLANIALNELYGKHVNAFAPAIKNVEYKGGECVVNFDMHGENLEARGEPKGVEVKIGENWVATDKVSTDEKGAILVKSPNGEAIEGVRYLWKSWTKPDVFLYNKGGLPAIPFTDSKK